MSGSVSPGMREAGEAIRLRLLVHAALDRDDLDAVVKLNRIADAAYAALSPVGAGVYLAWARQWIPTRADIFGGDA